MQRRRRYMGATCSTCKSILSGNRLKSEMGFVTETAVKAAYGARHEFLTNAAGDVVQQTETRKDGSGSPLQFTTSFAVDQQGRVRVVTYPLTDGIAAVHPHRQTVITPQTDECDASPATTTYEITGAPW